MIKHLVVHSLLSVGGLDRERVNVLLPYAVCTKYH